MNKISKKIVALATMGAFVLTLVPAAAFAAPVSSQVAVEDAEITLDGNTTSATAVVDVDLVAEDAGTNLIAWVTTGDNVLYRHAEFVVAPADSEDADTEEPTPTGDANWNNYGIYPVTADKAADYRLGVTFKEAGTYTIHVAANIADGGIKNVDQIGNPQLAPEIGSATVTVADAVSIAKSIDAADVTYSGTPDGVNKGATVLATVKGVYKGAEEETAEALADKKVTISAPAGFDAVKNGVVTELTTNDEGQISFGLIADKSVTEGVYTLKLTCDDVTKNILVTVGEEKEARTVEAVDTGKDVVSTDTKDLSSVAQVVFKNEDGKSVNFVDSDETDKVDEFTNIRVLESPEDYDGEFSLVKDADSNNYKLSTTEYLVTGKYVIRIALTGKDSVDITFTAQPFGEAVSSKIEVTLNNETVTNVYDNDDITYTGTIYVVDENGLEKVVEDPNTTIGILKGASAVRNFKTQPRDGTFTFQVEDDSVMGEHDNAQIGTDIVFMAFNANEKVNAQATVTVADANNTQELALDFDSEAGEIGKYNEVNVTLVDEDGNIVDKDSVTVAAAVTSKSVEDANVQATMGKVENGEGVLRVYSDKETTADIIVVVKDANNIIYANTLTYAFGEQDIPVDTTVVMTIGSTDFVVNNEVITKEDSAPYIANDRTYVPFRALGEALGAEVNWDNDARTVTYTLGKTEVVMTIGETTYTVNGEEKTMDVAPEISGDRTYVPVRFVGEALGFKVTALYAADGTTSSVVFQK